ncbi:MAG: hypothetical protein ACKVWV_04775 [Planctomycetota bacterium]
MLAFPLAAHASGSSTIQASDNPDALVSLDHRDGGNASRTGFVVRDGVLWFTDEAAMQNAYSTSVAMSQLAQEVGQDDNIARRAIEESNGFRSLRTELEENEFRVTVRGTRIEDITVPDPALQALLSVDGELAIGRKLLVFDEEGVHQLSADALTAPRTSQIVNGTGVFFPSHGTQDGAQNLAVCYFNKTGKVVGYYGPGNTYRVVGYAWASNWSNNHTVGVRTVSQRLLPLGPFWKWWVQSAATSVSVVGPPTSTMTLVSTGCTAPTAVNPSAGGNNVTSVTDYLHLSPTVTRGISQNTVNTFHSVTSPGGTKTVALTF